MITPLAVLLSLVVAYVAAFYERWPLVAMTSTLVALLLWIRILWGTR